MNKKYFNILIFLSLVLLLIPSKLSAQKAQKDNYVKIESVVTDEKGTPLSGATIYGNEGLIVAKTDASGMFSISVPSQTDLFIESNGFESRLFKPGEIQNLKSFQLTTSPLLYSSHDLTNIAFAKISKGDVVGSLSVIEPDEITDYDNTQLVSTALAGRIPGMLGSSNIRGIGTPLFIVDGLPSDISSLTMAEVAQVTVLKDINSSILYGSKAVNGVVLITTKRGEAYKQQVKVNGYYGVSTPLALPKYLSSADYMELYNEARRNDGLSEPYTADIIENYRSGNKYRYPNIDYYSPEYIKSFKPFFKATTELSGGNEVATYYSNIGWSHDGSIMNFGQGKDGGQNVFNIRGNVDLNINKWVKTSIDAVAIFDNSTSQTGSYWSDAGSRRPNLYSPLLPIDLMAPSVSSLVNSRKTDVDGLFLLGGTSSYLTNAIAEGYAGGYMQGIRRTYSFSNRVDVNLGDLVKGLAFHTNIGFDLYTQYSQSVDNSYSVYEPTWSATADSITGLKKYASDVRTGDQIVGGSYFSRRFAFNAMFDYDRTFSGVHHIYASLLGTGHAYKFQGDEQGVKDFNFGLRVAYSLNKKYMADFSAAYINSTKMPESERMMFSPTLGLAWMISSEDFMSGLTFIDYLKLRATAGIMGSDAGIDGFFYYDNKYGTSSSYNWYEGTYSNSGVISNYGGNMLLGFEKRKELNAGFEGSFFKKFLAIEANLFTSQYFDQITRPTTLYPSFYTNFLPYKNFDNNAYKGAEIGITLNKKFGNINLSVGANALYTTSEVKVRDEVWENDYQYRVGRPVDARYALVAEGFFLDQSDIDNHALQAFGTVRPGDIKYIDQNGDGIVNSNDQVMVGRSQAPFSYGLNFRINYKAFTLFALGYGRMGADNYMSSSYYWIDGDDKYSETVLNRWTEERASTATYPRLSSQSSTNNFQNSTFWLYKDNYFDIQRIQLSYELPGSIAGKLYMKRLSCYVDASNLYTLSKYREVRDLSVGAEPQYRSFSLGVKTLF